MGSFIGQKAQVASVDAVKSLTMDNDTIFDRFLKTNPPSFVGTDKLQDVEIWLLQMKKIFDVLGCSKIQKVALLAYKLQGGAEYWWRLAKQHCLVWSNFKKDFEDKNIPPAVKDQVRIEFLNLKQGHMSVAGCEQKFDEL